jgi:YHS domain-containing protein/thiol-disulfide isomerase/thioredoxin
MVSGMALAGHGPGWQVSFEDAERQAAQQQIPLLVHFHASWCGPCHQMDQRVFSSPIVQRALQEGLTAVKVDIAERPDLKDRFGADSIPRDIVVYPDGAVETLSVGMVPQGSYLSLLRNTAARGRSIAMTRMEEAETEEIEKRSQVVESVPTMKDAAEDKGIVGLSGYCPVILSGRKEWVRGQADLTERYRGVLYHFSGEKQRDQFLENPDRYAPRNLGCDPVVLFKEQRAVTGRIRYGAFFDGKLYLFRTAQSRSEFRRKPLRYTRIQHAIKPAELTGQTFS